MLFENFAIVLTLGAISILVFILLTVPAILASRDRSRSPHAPAHPLESSPKPGTPVVLACLVSLVATGGLGCVLAWAVAFRAAAESQQWLALWQMVAFGLPLACGIGWFATGRTFDKSQAGVVTKELES